MKTTEFVYDALPASPIGLVTLPVTVAKGETLLKGTLVTMVEGEVKALDGAEGAEVYGIIATDVDAVEEEQGAVVYVEGTFNKEQLIAEDVDAHLPAMRKIGLHVRSEY